VIGQVIGHGSPANDLIGCCLDFFTMVMVINLKTARSSPPSDGAGSFRGECVAKLFLLC